MADMDMDEFLGHKTSGGFEKNTYLGKWKDREAGKNRPAKAVDVWLHRNAPITALWRHQLPRVVVLEKKNETKVWSQNLVCWEEEELLKKQYKRNDDGTRVAPPTRCPICKLIEWLRQQVEAGELSWVEPAFKFKGDDEATVLHVGGLYNAYGADDLSDAEKAELKKSSIYRKDAWKQNAQAKATYCFRVVDNENPQKGVQVAIEPALLGDKVKAVIAKAMEEEEEGENGRAGGDPRRFPYAIRWKHLPDELEFGKKYDAVRMSKIKLSPEIDRLITETDPPDISQLKKKFDAAKLRAELEEAALIDIPWDEIFDGADKDVFDEAIDEQAKKRKPKPASSTPPDSDAGDDEEDEDDDADSAEDEEMVKCDKCKKPMKVSAEKCPHCGHEYDVEPAADDPKPKEKDDERKLPTRSELKKRKAEEAAAKEADAKKGKGDGKQSKGKEDKNATRVASEKKKPKDSSDPTFGEQWGDGDDVPF